MICGLSSYLITGWTDLPSRLPTQSSNLYSNNVYKFLLSLGGEGRFNIDLEDEVVRGSLVAYQGEILPPVPRTLPPPVTPRPTDTPKEEITEVKAITPFQKTAREVALITAGMGGVVGIGKATGTAFMDNFFTFGLAGLVGYRVVWNVAPALHSPLMSVTNAISGMVGIGGLFVMGGGYFPSTITQGLGALSVLLASVNVAGGFIITKRMLDMFKRGFVLRVVVSPLNIFVLGPTDPPEYAYLYGVPAVVFTGGFLAAASTGMAGLVQAGYLASSVLCIGAGYSSFFHLTLNNFTRLSFCTWIPGYCKARQCVGYIGRQLWNPCVTRCGRILS